MTMMKFGDVFNEFISQYRKKNPDNLEENVGLLLYNNWELFVAQYPEAQIQEILQKGSIESFSDGELIIKNLNSSEKFILQMQEEVIITHIEKFFIDIQKKDAYESSEKIKKIKFY